MGKHRALIIGAGRMGSGWGLTERAHYYVHAKTYMDLADRVELVGFVEPDDARAKWASERWKLPAFASVKAAMKDKKPNIISVCTPPEHRDFMKDLPACVEGVWCEKPFTFPKHEGRQKVQVNYCRRFDRFHNTFKRMLKDSTFTRLVFMGKKDVHTVCHITDLARWWCVDKLDYVDTPGEPGAYMLRAKIQEKVWFEQFFPSGGLSGDEFMKVALGNLLDAVEGKAELISPPENAIKSEEWANKILEGS